MGHLKASCPKLARTYPLNIESVNGSKGDKVEVGNSGTDNHTSDVCPVDKIEQSKMEGEMESTIEGVYTGGDTHKTTGVGGETSGIELELGRCWEFEQGGPQITDV